MFIIIQLFLTCKRINKYHFIVLSLPFLKLMFVLAQTRQLIAEMLVFSLQIKPINLNDGNQTNL